MSDPAAPPRLAGVLLAAGEGRRMGRPKALVSDPATGEPWLARGVGALSDAGCDPVIVVLGAAADEAAALLRTSLPEVRAVVTPDWREGIAASLRAGLAAAASASASTEKGADAVVVTLVDLPHLAPAAIARITGAAAKSELRTSLRQATYDGRPGHPVLIGAEHLASLIAHLHGDVGARPYLVAHGVTEVDCTDLGGGDDVDTPPHP